MDSRFIFSLFVHLSDRVFTWIISFASLDLVVFGLVCAPHRCTRSFFCTRFAAHALRTRTLRTHALVAHVHAASFAARTRVCGSSLRAHALLRGWICLSFASDLASRIVRIFLDRALSRSWIVYRIVRGSGSRIFCAFTRTSRSHNAPHWFSIHSLCLFLISADLGIAFTVAFSLFFQFARLVCALASRISFSFLPHAHSFCLTSGFMVCALFLLVHSFSGCARRFALFLDHTHLAHLVHYWSSDHVFSLDHFPRTARLRSLSSFARSRLHAWIVPGSFSASRTWIILLDPGFLTPLPHHRLRTPGSTLHTRGSRTAHTPPHTGLRILLDHVRCTRTSRTWILVLVLPLGWIALVHSGSRSWITSGSLTWSGHTLSRTAQFTHWSFSLDRFIVLRVRALRAWIWIVAPLALRWICTHGSRIILTRLRALFSSPLSLRISRCALFWIHRTHVFCTPRSLALAFLALDPHLVLSRSSHHSFTHGSFCLDRSVHSSFSLPRA